MAISQYLVGLQESHRRNRNCLHEIATAPSGHRNDKFESRCGRRSTRKFATALGAHNPQGARRIRKAAKPPTAAQ